MRTCAKVIIAASLVLNACGLDLQNEAEKTVEELTMVENASVPKAILVVTDETTNEEKSYEVDANLSENMTDAEKANLVETLKGREISNVESNEGFFLGADNIELPGKISTNGYRYGYRRPYRRGYRRSFYGYGYGYRFPYSYRYGYRYRRHTYRYYRPQYRHRYGYRYSYRNYGPYSRGYQRRGSYYNSRD